GEVVPPQDELVGGDVVDPVGQLVGGGAEGGAEPVDAPAEVAGVEQIAGDHHGHTDHRDDQGVHGALLSGAGRGQRGRRRSSGGGAGPSVAGGVVLGRDARHSTGRAGRDRGGGGRCRGRASAPLPPGPGQCSATTFLRLV